MGCELHQCLLGGHGEENGARVLYCGVVAGLIVHDEDRIGLRDQAVLETVTQIDRVESVALVDHHLLLVVDVQLQHLDVDEDVQCERITSFVSRIPTSYLQVLQRLKYILSLPSKFVVIYGTGMLCVCGGEE